LSRPNLFYARNDKKGRINFGTHDIAYSHSDEDVNFIIKAYEEVFSLIKSAIVKNNLQQLLECEILKPLFKVK
jgi:glutamate-1-semialdehyde 2,1-aminomutase